MRRMSTRGELTHEFQRQGEWRAREDSWFDEETDTHPAPAVPVRHGVLRPHTLFEPEPWRARIGVRCGVVVPETKNP
jgi:hypothetical protein